MLIAGYHVQEQLYESENSLIYRGCREAEEQSVILKMLKQPYPPPEKIAWFRREYELTRGLDLEKVIKVYNLTTDQHRPVMVLEDFGGESLELHLKKRRRLFPPAEFLPLAIQIAEILSQVHQQHVMHKDVNPSNVVWNPQTGQVKLIDFGISTVLSRENPVVRNPTVGEGTLAYISPEQTGRMNRAMDYRTDLYSLGVTFYELLTGQLPFPTNDAMALLHAHIAKQPPAPQKIIPDLPQFLSALVMKLLAKNAEDRYQSAHGLKVDLEECVLQPQIVGRSVFPLGQHDTVSRFNIPQRLYGRERDVDILLTAFGRVSQGSGETMLISGHAGIGKSALVHEVYKPITRQRGYFITGKFDQLHRNIPYAPLTQAFRSLMQQLLTESETQVASWREQLLTALGPNGRVLIDVIPEVTLIIGPQPPVPTLPPAEAQNRLSLVFQNFIRVFTRAEHPLVLFLDDLQWADAASLNLVRLLMTAPDNQYLFVIGAYRDNEVHEAHPLMLALNEIQKAGSIVNRLVLQPLDSSDVCWLIADTLKSTTEEVRPLAELVLAKTNGNPFFVNEFLKSLYSEELLTFDFQRRGWQWNIAHIRGRNITENVVALMSEKVQRLGQQTQQVLKLAACIGNQFDLRTLAIVYEHSVKETAADLWEAMEEGLVLPLGNTYKLMDLDVQGLSDVVTVDYKFAHDRIQQAAYSLIPEVEKQVVHWRVGQLLLQNTSPDDREQKIFDIVNHFNLGRGLIRQQAEQDELAELNLTAGKKAKAAAAYGPACNYLQVGLSLLGKDAWERRYDLALALHTETAEAVYLNGDFEQMERLTDTVFQRAKTLPDAVRAYEVRLSAYSLQKRQRDGVKLGLRILGLLEIHLPENPTQADIIQALQETQRVLEGETFEDLLDLPRMTDPHKLAAIGILLRLYHHAYTGAPELYPLIVSKIVSLSVRYGNTPHSALGYAGYGFVLCAFIGDIETGYQFGQLALRLVEQFNAREIKSGALFIFNAFIRHWKEHIKETLPSLLEAYQIGLETGDLSLGTISALDYGFQLYWMGKGLMDLDQELAKYSSAFQQLKQDHILVINDMYRQVVANLRGQSEDPCRLRGAHYDEETLLPRFTKEQDANALAQTYLHKLILCYLFYDYAPCVTYAEFAEKYLNGVAGTPAVPAFHFYDSLARLALVPDIQEPERESLLRKVVANQEKMKLWAQHAPMNYSHKFYLVEAERARVLGKDAEAREHYDKAITLAQENEYLNEEALAYELASRFYLARGQSHLARYYLRDAHYAYQRWGAVAKVRDLEKRYPQFFEAQTPPGLHQPLTSASTVSTEQQMSNLLDVSSVLKASQTIASEIILDRLLTRLIRIVIENAGARRGCLILEKDGQLVVEAEGRVDSDEVLVLQSIPVETRRDLPTSIIRYVARTKAQVVLSEAIQEAIFATDPYITREQPKSILCAPLVKQGKLTGILYLENNLATGAFTPDRLEIVNLLSAQAAISIENADLYRSLEASKEQLENYSKTLELKVEQRTHELQNRNLALELANEQVREANRRKSQFLAGMSHELRTPMNAIIGFTRLVLRRTGDLLPERQHDNLVKVIESASQLLNLINQLLDLSRLEAGRMQVHPGRFDVRRLILTCCEMVSPLVKPGVHLQQEIADTVGEMYTDEEGVRHVVLNLLSNAIKFTDSGEVVVRAWVNNGQGNGDAALGIAVSDTGVGIPDDALETIFEEFQQVEGGIRKREGTGLGLPIARRWVGLLGGSIVAESELEKGSTFTVTVPVIYQNP